MSGQGWLQIQFGGQLKVQNCQKFEVHLGLSEIEWGCFRQKVLSQRQGLSFAGDYNSLGMFGRVN